MYRINAPIMVVCSPILDKMAFLFQLELDVTLLLLLERSSERNFHDVDVDADQRVNKLLGQI